MLRTIKTRALIACLITMCVTVGIAVLSLVVEHRLADDLSQTRRIASALRNHTVADMYHEGLQSSAYAALTAAELKVPRADIEKELRERIGKFRQAIGENHKLDLPAEIREALKALEAPLAAYIAAAERIVPLAFDNRPAALAAMAQFNQTFERLEQAQDAVGDRIGAAAEALNSSASEFGAFATVTALVALALGGAVTAALLVYVLFGMVGPLQRIKHAMHELAQGNFEIVLPGLGRPDEIGAMAAAVDEFKVRAIEKAQRDAQEREAQARAAADQRRRREEHEAEERRAADKRQERAAKDAIHKVVNEFQAEIGTVVETVASAATELEASADALTAAANATQKRANSVAAASEEASANVQSVASASEQLSMSVDEISKQVQASREIAQRAVAQAQRTDAQVTELSQAASRIGDVVKLITAIAEQTNLLALNATIEAARAGEAGKGFAVVAQEVKALAAQTAKATGDIGAQIASMQAATEESVKAIKEIGNTISNISDISGAISSAVHEQGAATQEIARNVDEASKGTADVSANITEVSQHASETGAASAQMLGSAKSLAREGSHLKRAMEQFLETIRTGIGNRREADDPNYRGAERRRDAIVALADQGDKAVRAA